MTNDTPVSDEALQELHEAANSAVRKLNDLRRRRRDYVRTETEAAAARIEAAAAQEYDQQIAREKTLALEAVAALEDAMDRRARHGIGARLPLGAKVVKWEVHSRLQDGLTTKRKTGQLGVIEMITRDSVHPKASKPGGAVMRADIGDVVIRLLLANGKPATTYLPIPTKKLDGEMQLVVAPHSLPPNWFYEGEDANNPTAAPEALP